MNIESMSKMDKLVLISFLGLELNQSMEDIDSILQEVIEEYSIDYTTGNVSIVYKKPMEVLTIKVKL